MYARNDGAIADPHSTTITHTVDRRRPTRGTCARGSPQPRADRPAGDRRRDAGVFVQETGGDTVVPRAARPADDAGLHQHAVVACDSYLLRLNKPPTDDVKVGLITDGQTDVDLAHSGPNVDARGGRRARRLPGVQERLHHDHSVDRRRTRRSRARTAPTSAASSTRASRRASGSSSPARAVVERRLHGHRPRDRLPDRDAGAGAAGPPAGTLGGCAAPSRCRAAAASRSASSTTAASTPASSATTQNYVTQLFNGGYTIAGNLVTARPASFLDDGLRGEHAHPPRGPSGTTDFVVTDVSDTQLTLNGAPAGRRAHRQDRPPERRAVRDDGKSWLDSGFLEGQLFK